MRLQANTHSAFTIVTPVRHMLAGRACAALSVLVALLMTATLIGPSAYIIAEKATSTPHGLQSSVLVTTSKDQNSAISSGQALNHSTDRLDESADKEGGKKSSDKKRPRGPLPSNDRISSSVAILVPYESIQLQVDDGDREVSTASTGSIPKSNLLPPQLLQRPPPEK